MGGLSSQLVGSKASFGELFDAYFGIWTVATAYWCIDIVF